MVKKDLDTLIAYLRYEVARIDCAIDSLKQMALAKRTFAKERVFSPSAPARRQRKSSCRRGSLS